MPRIFLTLAVASTSVLLAAFVMGLMIGDPGVAEPVVQRWVSYHFLVAVAGLSFAALVHAIVLTYFMGTGRWMEETAAAYSLPDIYRSENQQLKYRMVPAMFGCFALLVATGAMGSAADPASPVGFVTWLGASAATWHFLLATTSVGLNLVVNLWEYQALVRNQQIIASVLAEVRRIRAERGLPV